MNLENYFWAPHQNYKIFFLLLHFIYCTGNRTLGPYTFQTSTPLLSNIPSPLLFWDTVLLPSFLWGPLIGLNRQSWIMQPQPPPSRWDYRPVSPRLVECALNQCPCFKLDCWSGVLVTAFLAVKQVYLCPRAHIWTIRMQEWLLCALQGKQAIQGSRFKLSKA